MSRPIPIVPTDFDPTRPARRVGDATPELLLTPDHHMCPGCGEPLVLRTILETITQLGVTDRTIAVAGIGCYTSFGMTTDIDVLQALHGRAPSVATGAKRMNPDRVIYTLQGDGDMVNEGLQEVIHAAARGEKITCVMLNNGVFGETGGHMAATTVLGQRTKTSLAGRDADEHGYPIKVADMLADLDGVAYVARGSVHSAAEAARTRKFVKRAFEAQLTGAGFGFVEVLTMCPTGWFIPTTEGPEYQSEVLGAVHEIGELKHVAARGDASRA